MALDLRKVREIVQALLRAWNKKDEGNLLESAAQTSTASGDGSNGKPTLAGTGYSSPSQPGVTTGDGAASQSPGTPSRPANVQTIHGRPLNAARLRAVELATLLVFGGTGTHQRPENTNKGLSDPGVHIYALCRRSWGHCGTAKTTPPGQGAAILRLADGESDMARKAPHQEKQLPEIRCKRSSEVNWQGRPGQVRWQVSPRKPRKAGKLSGCEKVDTGFRKNPALRIDHFYELGLIQPKLIAL